MIILAIVFGGAGFFLAWLVWDDVAAGQTSIRARGEPKQTYYRQHTPGKFWLAIGFYIFCIAMLLLVAAVFLQATF